MRKSIIAVLLIALTLIACFGSCTSKTPDVIASEQAAAVNLDSITWSLNITGAEKTTYTREEAEAHELSKVIVSMYVAYENGPDGNGIAGTIKSFICEGIKMSEFLADIGAADAASLTFHGKDHEGKDVDVTIEGDDLQNDKVIVGWIMNKTEILPNFTESYVGIFCDSSVSSFDCCCSVTDIEIG